MDSGDHTMIHAPGHEAVHVCHRCGWAFPNSHPSARHRRAHKKLCGTLEGFKLVDPNGSDDGSHSDEDHKTPSPRLLEQSVNEKGSFGIGDRSNRSEEEVFADAAAEFSDSSGFSPGVEEHSVDARKSVSNMERVVKDGITSNQTINDVAIVVGSMVNLISGRTSEESVVVLSNPSNSQLCDSHPIKYENPSDDTLHESEAKADKTVTERSSTVLEQGNISRENPQVKVDSVSEDIVHEHSLTEMTEEAPKLEETKERDVLSAEELDVFQSKEDNTEGLNPNMSTSGSDASFDIVQISAGTSRATDSTSSILVGEGCDVKEGNESVHTFSVPEDVYIVDRPEIILEGFKGHKGLKLHQPVPLDNEATLKSPSCEDNLSGFESKQLSEGSGVTCPAVPVLQNDLDGKFTAKEVPFGGEVSLPQEMLSVDENRQSDVGVSAYAATIEMKNNHTISSGKEEIPCDVFRDCLSKSFSDVATEVVPDVKFTESFMDAKVNETTDLVDMAEAGNHEKGGFKKLDMAGNENSEGVLEDDSTENTRKIHESLSNISEFQINPSKGYSVGNGEKYDVAENWGSGRALEENVLTSTKAVSELAYNLPISPVASVDVTDGTNDKVSGIGCPQMDTVEDSSSVGTDVSNIQQGREDKIEYVDIVSVPSQSRHVEDLETFQKASEHHIVEERVVLPQDSVSPEEYGPREIGRGASRIGSETLQSEGGDNTATQQFAAADVSTDSYSQTDSLEAHWGSVSVFSTQSDVPTVIDAESLPSTDSLAPEGVVYSSKPKVEAHERSDKPDVCEPPSFSTLAETGQKVDDCSDIQNAQQSISASPKAGWFPSLTNVVNDSPGRKKNEEFIAKVTNWSSGGSGKQHTPLKSLMGETSLETKPKSPSSKESTIPPEGQKDDAEAKGNSVNATTVHSIMGTESPAAVQATTESSGKKRNSPAEIKREKGKVKGKPLWAPFVCCYSVKQD